MNQNSYISYFKIEETGCISIRRTNNDLDEFGNVKSYSYWRIVLEPGEHRLEDYIDDPQLLEQAQSVWTPEFVQNYVNNKNQNK